MKYYVGSDTVPWTFLTEAGISIVHNQYTRRLCKFQNYWLKSNRDGSKWYLENAELSGNSYITGNYAGYGRDSQTYLNLKHVPKSIKNADYGCLAEWFEAVFRFISRAKEKARGKSQIRQEQDKLRKSIEFMDFRSDMEPVAERYGFLPDDRNVPASCTRQGMRTWNEIWSSYPDEAWRKDSVKFRKGKVTVQADVKCRGSKLTVDNLPSGRIKEVVEAVARILGQ